MVNRRSIITFIITCLLVLTACSEPLASSATSENSGSSGSMGIDTSVQDDIQGQVNSVRDRLGAVEDAARRGDYAAAKSLHAEAYGLYESGLDKFVDSRNPSLAEEIDRQFGAGDGQLLSLIEIGASPDAVAAGVDRLKDRLDEAATYSAGNVTGALVALNSAVIILREGLEAVLILAIILGYMRTTKRDPKYARLVFAGIGAAVVLSLLTWWASQTVLSMTSVNRELLEGGTSLLAVAVLFYCTNWLFHKAYVVDWMSFVKAETGKALAAGSSLGLVALGFTVVYREGFETVLFYQAMMFNSDPAPIFAGLAAGLALLALIAVGVLRVSVKLPVRPFFSVTGALMLVLAFKFAGMGVHAIHEAGLIGATPVLGMGESIILREVLGIYPFVETLTAQALLLVGVGVTFVISRWQWKHSAAASAQMI